MLSFPAVVQLKNGKSLQIDRPCGDHAKEILDFLELVGAETDNLTFGRGELPFTIEYETKFLEACRTSNTDLALMGKVNGQIISVLTFTRMNRLRLVHVGDFGVSVLKAHWGIGVGLKMMEYFLQWAKENEVKKVELRVRKDNLPAIGLYKKLGFEVEGTRKMALRIKGEFIDELYMGLVL